MENFLLLVLWWSDFTGRFLLATSPIKVVGAGLKCAE
jgi:hypothetical protein